MTETLASVLEAFTTHRLSHRKGAYPAALRRRAVDQLTRTERHELAARLGLSAAQVDRWDRVKAMGSAPTADFFDVTPPQVEAKPVAFDGLQVEVALPTGACLRLRGHVDAPTLRCLVAALHEAGAAT
jgi:hypothetical protein